MGSHLYIKMAQGGRNSSSQFRNFQVHGESRKSSRAQFLLQESSMPVTLMNMTGDILCIPLLLPNSEWNLARFWDGTCEPKGANIAPSLWCHTPWLVHQSWATLRIGFVIPYQKVFTWRARLQEISLKKFPDTGKFLEAMRDKKCYQSALETAKTREVPMHNARALVKEALDGLETHSNSHCEFVELFRLFDFVGRVVERDEAGTAALSKIWCRIADFQTQHVPVLDGYCTC